MEAIEFKGGGLVKMTQKAYIETILKQFNMDGEEGRRATKFPMNNVDLPSRKDVPDLETSECRLTWKQVESFPYRAAIGSLAHAARWTYQVCFGTKHITAIKHMFRYLLVTIDEGITFGGSDFRDVC